MKFLIAQDADTQMRRQKIIWNRRKICLMSELHIISFYIRFIIFLLFLILFIRCSERLIIKKKDIRRKETQKIRNKELKRIVERSINIVQPHSGKTPHGRKSLADEYPYSQKTSLTKTKKTIALIRKI